MGDVNKMEFSNLKKTFSLENALKRKENIYFLASLEPTDKRANDQTITSKNYFYIDFDIRQNCVAKDKQIITDTLLEVYLWDIVNTLNYDEYLSERSAIVFTGNGYHFYYIWDDIDYINPKLYALGMERIHKRFDTFLGKDIFKVDIACKNISRVSRLPWSINYARKVKYNLEPKECTVIDIDKRKSRLVWLINSLGKKELEEHATQELQFEQKNYSSSWGSKIDEILAIPLKELVCNDFGLRLAPDWKNFLWENRKGYQGLFVWINEKGNEFLLNIWSHYLAEAGMDKKGYDTFSYIKNKNGLDNKQTYQRFEDNYAHIRAIDTPKQDVKKILKQDLTPPNLLNGKRYTWGTPTLDKTFALIKEWTYTVIVWETGDGKTTFAYHQAIQNAKLGHKVLYISLEMETIEILDNIARNFAGITIEEEFNKTISEWKIWAYEKKIEELNNIKNLTTVWVRKWKDVTILTIKEIIAKQKKVDLVYLDNLDLISTNNSDDENTRQRKISKEIMWLTSDLKIPVVLLHHYRKKASWTAKSSTRSLDDIWGNRKITHDADRILQLRRNHDKEASPKERASLSLFIEKARSYGRWLWTVYFYRGEFLDELPEDNPTRFHKKN